MKIAAAQIRPIPGEIEVNLTLHLDWIASALDQGAEAVFFSELSLTGYEPHLAQSLQMRPDDPVLAPFQALADGREVLIGIGLPTTGLVKPRISLLVFSPHQPRQLYSKQLLHEDERPWFEAGDRPVLLEWKGLRMAPAICYESLQPQNGQQAADMGADVYVASVAKPAGGVTKAEAYFPEFARQHALPVLMANCVGPADNFVAVGQSAYWNAEGKLVGKMSERGEGVLVVEVGKRIKK